MFGSIDPHHNYPPSNPPTINSDGGDDCPPHERPPNERQLLRGVIIKGGDYEILRCTRTRASLVIYVSIQAADS